MRARLDLCVQKGFDAVEFDNVDGYANDTGFPLTYGDQLRYNAFLANAAHARGLAAALKNDLEQVPDLLPYFDMMVVEQCFQYRECEMTLPFVHADKPVFEVEYRLSTDRFCATAAELGINAIRKRLALGSWREACQS